MRIIQSLNLFRSKTFRAMSAFCQNRDIAIVSSKIIDMIQNQKKEDTKCLGLKIAQLTVKEFPEKYPIQPKNLQIVKQMFTTGVQLPQCYRKQGRILKALKAGQGQNNQSKLLFVFYPTWITTTYVFKYMREKDSQCLFTGDRGVGKTSSFILYSMLMNNITKYVMSNKEAAIKLIKDKTIRPPEKVFYWSFQEQIQQGIIVNQCPQMFNNNVNSKQYLQLLKQQQSNFKTLSEKIKRFYNLGNLIKRVIIIDQINTLAKLIREHNENKKMNKFRGQQQIQSRQNLYSCNLNRKKISGIAEYKIYNSSANIQDQLLSLVTRTDKNEEHLIINTHEQLASAKLNYHLRIDQAKAKDQTLHYIGMEYKRYFAKFTESQIQEKMKEWIKQQTKGLDKKSSGNAQQKSEHMQISKTLNENIQIIKNIIKPNIQFAIPLLYVRYYLQKTEFSPMKFKSRIQNYYTDKLKLLQRFNLKISSIDDVQRLKIDQITILLHDHILSLQQQTKQIIFDRKKLFEKMKLKFSNINQEDDIDKYMDPTIFPYQDNKQGYICLIPGRIAKQFFRILTITYVQMNSQYCFQRVCIDKQANPSLIGIVLEKIMIRAMIKCIENKGSFEMQGISYQLVAQGKFYQFNNTKENEIKLQGRMDQMIELAKKNKDKYCLCLPYHIGGDKKISHISKSVDLCLIKCTSNQKYEFIFVDIKSGNQLKLNKLNKSAEQFKKNLQLSLKSSNISYNIDDFKLHIACKNKFKSLLSKQHKDIKVVDILTFKFEAGQVQTKQFSDASKILEIVAQA